MTIVARLDQWKERGIMSPEQHKLLAGLWRLRCILAFVAGLGWTVSAWSQQLGDVLVLTILTTCFSRFQSHPAPTGCRLADDSFKEPSLPSRPAWMRSTLSGWKPYGVTNEGTVPVQFS
jgi:hypothetical protein